MKRNPEAPQDPIEEAARQLLEQEHEARKLASIALEAARTINSLEKTPPDEAVYALIKLILHTTNLTPKDRLLIASLLFMDEWTTEINNAITFTRLVTNTIEQLRNLR